MSESKSKKVRVLFGVLLITFIVIVSWALFFDAAYRQKPSHSIILYNSQGDSLLGLDTESECIKIWIEDSCEVDVWTINEEGGWTRK
jgi:hypothetical protein